jgi:hypothetical protein
MADKGSSEFEYVRLSMAVPGEPDSIALDDELIIFGGADATAEPDLAASAAPVLIPIEKKGLSPEGLDEHMPFAQKATIAFALAGLLVLALYLARYWL